MSGAEPFGSARRSAGDLVSAAAVAARPEGSPSDPSAPLVLKLGGRALDAPGAIDALASDLAAHDGPALLVHGGGAEVTDWCARLGLPAAFHDGLRVTDEATLEVAVAVLAGLANKRLVAALRAAGVDAVGLAALDGGIVEVTEHPHAGALGHVGAVRAARGRLVRRLWSAGGVPVLASIAAHAGRLLNVNADDVAGALAADLGARLVMLSDIPGLQLDGHVVPALSLSSVEPTLARADVTGGMRPKLRAAAGAVAAGAPGATLCDWRGPGTLARALAGTIGTTLAPGTTAAAAEPVLPEEALS